MVGGVRSAGILTRSWTVAPATTNYCAESCSTRGASHAYGFSSDAPLRRNPRLSMLGPRKFQSSARHTSDASSSAIPHISLHIAASSSGKGRKFRPEQNTYDYVPKRKDVLGVQEGETMQQLRSSRPDSGQDAYFVARVGNNRGMTAFGIADGVGGWAAQGIDPADFSHGLCSYMADTARRWSAETLSPRKLLEVGFQMTIDDTRILGGGSTACVAVADRDGRMRVANLGDSGFLQLRMGTVHHYSNPQTHAFNTPYQLSITPPEILAQSAIFGGAPLADMPDKADIADHMLRHGDVLILATDGVWDNLNSQDVLNIVSSQMRVHKAWHRSEKEGFVVADTVGLSTDPEQLERQGLKQTLQASIASAVVREAKVASMNAKRDGPFAKEVQKYYPEEGFHGGKVDDISVLVVISLDMSKTEESLKAKL